MLRKNNGQVLVIVLFIITISFILITGLFSLSVNTRYQINHSEGDLQITNAAEMGISLFERNVLNVIQNNDYKTLKDLIQQLNDQLLALKGEKTLDRNLSFNISNVDVSSSTDDSKRTSIIILKVTSQGKLNESIKTLDKTYTLRISNDNGGEDSSSKDIFTDKSQFSALTDDTFPTLSSSLNGPLTPAENITHCQYKGNVNFDFTDVFFNTCDYNIDGNAKFNNYYSISLLTKFSISHDALFNGIYYLGYKSVLSIGGNAVFNGSVYQNLFIQFYRQALTINGDSRFNHSVHFNYSKNSILGNTLFQDRLNLFGANLSIGKNVYFANDVYMSTSSTMTIGGSAYFSDYVYVSPSSSLRINGSLFADHFMNVAGTACVNGSSDITNTNTNANIVRNINSCGHSPGTIYILNQPVQNDDELNNSNIEINSSNVNYH